MSHCQLPQNAGLRCIPLEEYIELKNARRNAMLDVLAQISKNATLTELAVYCSKEAGLVVPPGNVAEPKSP